MTNLWQRHHAGGLLLLGMLLCIAVYLPGLPGGFVFDDYPNIVDNPGVQPDRGDVPSLMAAALSSPSSELKRPLASLSFAANYLATGLSAGPMKVTNLAIHLLNGVLVFLLLRSLLAAIDSAGERRSRNDLLAASIACIWMLLPINLTCVLYVVQRMESLANLCVLAGLWAYVAGRRRMQQGRRGLFLAVAGVLAGSAAGLLSKETSVMTPLYAFFVEALVFRWNTRRADGTATTDRRVIAFFAICLLLPMIASLFWLVPMVLSPKSWATRDFTLITRLLSETRIVLDYIGWTLVPLPSALSFYHDDFLISQGLLSPPSTLWSLLGLLALILGAWVVRHRMPLFALGVGLYIGAHLLTGTVIPLELIYEHRNYFPSMAVLVALAGLFFRPQAGKPAILAGVVVFAAVATGATLQTARTADAWGAPLPLAEELASRAPDSPRAQYELGRAYIIDSHYDRHAVSTPKAYPPLERAAAMPRSTILPLQALVFFNARMRLPIPPAWWDAMADKLASRRPGVEDESSLIALTQCMDSGACDLPAAPMHRAYEAAMSHPPPSGRLLSAYADFAWNQLGNRAFAEDLQRRAVEALPKEPAHRITLIRFQIAAGHLDDATHSLDELARLDYGGSLNDTLKRLHEQLVAKRKGATQ